MCFVGRLERRVDPCVNEAVQLSVQAGAVRKSYSTLVVN